MNKKNRERLKALDAKYERMSAEQVEQAQKRNSAAFKAKLNPRPDRKHYPVPNSLPLNTGSK
jgi:hypothetical protein